MENMVRKESDKNFWINKRVLVTGANGFLGYWITKRLTELDANVVVLIRDMIPNSLTNDLYQNKKILALVNGDLRDRELLVRLMNEYDIRYCFHLAAQAIVGVANKSPISTFESNIMGTWNVLEAARIIGLDGVIVASSDKVYGDQKVLPIKEDQKLLADYPYDVSKVCADYLTGCYFKTYELNVALTRCANLYGGGDFNLSRLIPGTIVSVLKGEDPVIRSDGKMLRDYLYIDDAVFAYLLLAERVSEAGVSGEAFNFGTYYPKTVLEVVERIISVSGVKKLKPIVLNEAKYEIKKQYLDSSKAKKLLGWESNTKFDDGISKTFAWYKNFFG